MSPDDSRKRAAASAANIAKLKADIEAAATSWNFDPALIAAIVSRETAALPVFCQPKGKLGDSGYGHGPMQIDKRSFPEWCANWAAGKLTVRDGIDMGCKVLTGKMKVIRKLVPGLSPEALLRAAVSGYNCGEGNSVKALKKGVDTDSYTTGKDYAADVLVRAEWFRMKWSQQ